MRERNKLKSRSEWVDVLQNVTKLGWEHESPPLMALMMISKSPSMTKLSKPSSLANKGARRAASSSTISTEVGSGICYDKAAITNLRSLRTIMPKPTMFMVRKRVPSKLIFTIPKGGGRHLTNLTVIEILAWLGLSCWNSWRESRAISGICFFPTRDLFLLIYISDTIIAKRLTWTLSSWASWMTSMKPKTDPVALIRLANYTCHTGDREGQDQRP